MNNCTNTISDGFYFWIGKSLAELATGLCILAIIAGGWLLYFMWATRSRK